MGFVEKRFDPGISKNGSIAHFNRTAEDQRIRGKILTRLAHFTVFGKIFMKVWLVEYTLFVV